MSFNPKSTQLLLKMEQSMPNNLNCTTESRPRSNKEYNWNRIQITWVSFGHSLIDDIQENKVSKIRKVEETIFMYTVTCHIILLYIVD